jgi:hypothetical protein
MVVNHTINVLEHVKNDLEDGLWSQGAIARDKRGFSCGAEDNTACSWCLTGLLLKHDLSLDYYSYTSGSNKSVSAIADAIRSIPELCSNPSANNCGVIINFNDNKNTILENCIFVVEKALENLRNNV